MNNTTNTMINLNDLLLIPSILKELEELREFKNSFTKEKKFIKTNEVLELLNLKSRTTIKNYVDNNILKEKEHYIKEDGRIKFIYSEILKFKNEFSKYSKSLHKKTKEQLELEKALERLASWKI